MAVTPDPSLRVTLQAADETRLARLRPWLAEALAHGGAAWAGRGADGPSAEDAVGYAIVVDETPVGYLEVAHSPDGIGVTAIAVDPERRNLCYGAEAVFAAEALGGTAGISRAFVPIENGLAVYFWLRIGYRPRFAADHGRPGVTVMERLTGAETVHQPVA